MRRHSFAVAAVLLVWACGESSGTPSAPSVGAGASASASSSTGASGAAGGGTGAAGGVGGVGGMSGTGGTSSGGAGGGGTPGLCKPVLVWPTTGNNSATLLHDAYGPRILSGSYDWHQGLDIPGHPNDGGFKDSVYAAATGVFHRIGNLPGNGDGSVAGFSKFSGNLIILEHSEQDSGLIGEGTIYTLYFHLAPTVLTAYPARIGGVSQIVDLTEYFFLDGMATTSGNRGTPRTNFKTGGAPILDRPTVTQSDVIATIGDSGSVSAFEHLHFEIRDREEPATSPPGHYRVWARNPYLYLPHDDVVAHSVSLASQSDEVVASLEIKRDLVAPGDVVVGKQQLDVESLILEIRSGESVVASRTLRFFQDVNQQGTGKFTDGKLGFDHPDFLSANYTPAEPDRSLGGVDVSIAPADFGGGTDTWKVDVTFSNLAAAGFVPGSGQHYAIRVHDLCGREAEATLPAL